MQHLRDYQSEKEEYYWHTAVIFIGEELDKALIRYLEHRLVEIAKASNRYDILTKLYIKNSSADAQGIATNEGFVVLKGSRISSRPVSDKISATIRQMRAEYIEQARIKDYILQEDILCTSPSAAAQMVLGYSVSGQII